MGVRYGKACKTALYNLYTTFMRRSVRRPSAEAQGGADEKLRLL